MFTMTDIRMHPRPRETKLASKKNRILNEVFRSGRCSRLDLARRLNINASMVGGYVDGFLREGCLIECEPRASRPGRAPVPLQLDPENGCFLGVDFEALRARSVLCDFAGQTLYQEEMLFDAGVSREQVLKRIVSMAGRLADRADRPLLSVGVAAPGQVDCRTGRVLHYQLLPDFDGAPVQDRFQEKFDAPVFVEDNIRALAFAELLRGSGRGGRNFLCLAVRSGVGLGIVIDGRLYVGANAMAGEVGYTVFPTPGGARTITDLVSAKGFVLETLRLLKSRQGGGTREQLLAKGEGLLLTDIVAAAEAGDELLHEHLERLGMHLGFMAANLANLFAPEKIILVGEVPGCSPIVRQTMERKFREFTLSPILTTAYLENGALGVFGGALGAAWLGFTRTFPEDEETLILQRNESLAVAG